MDRVRVFPDMDRLADEAASSILETGNQAIEGRGIFTFVLAGGSTPQPVYRRLAQAGSALDWSRVHIFWGDERCLPPDDPQSNYWMAWETLLAHISIPSENIHRIQAELAPVEAAEDYQHRISVFFNTHPALKWLEMKAGETPSFDLILLGMGNDGHVASLFPGSYTLEESIRWVVGVVHNQPPPPEVSRVTFTLPLINAAANICFLVSGESKAQRLKQVITSTSDPPMPAQQVRPRSGTLAWLVDQQAASRLPDNLLRRA